MVDVDKEKKKVSEKVVSAGTQENKEGIGKEKKESSSDKNKKVEKSDKVARSHSTKHQWTKIKPAEVEKLVVQFAKEGKSPAQIGLFLRDHHGIPTAKVYGKKITQILKDHTVSFSGDRDIAQKKIATLKKHLSKNIHDYSASLSLTKQLWVLYKLDRARA